MNQHPVSSRTAVLAPRLGILLLTLFCLALEATPAAAADATAPAMTAHAPAAPAVYAAAPPTALTNSGQDQTRMIQAGLIVVIVGIFLLVKSIK